MTARQVTELSDDELLIAYAAASISEVPGLGTEILKRMQASALRPAPSPACPACGGDPFPMLSTAERALCSNLKCHVWAWDPRQPAFTVSCAEVIGR
jgi:hypothetical protein